MQETIGGHGPHGRDSRTRPRAAGVLELKNDRSAHPADFGYSGWVQLEDGALFCVYHHGDGQAPDYEPFRSAHILGTRFYESDFGSV